MLLLFASLAAATGSASSAAARTLNKRWVPRYHMCREGQQWVGRFCDRTPGKLANQWFDLCTAPYDHYGRYSDQGVLHVTDTMPPYETLVFSLNFYLRRRVDSSVVGPYGMNTARLPKAGDPAVSYTLYDGFCEFDRHCLQVLDRTDRDPHIFCVQNPTVPYRFNGFYYELNDERPSGSYYQTIAGDWKFKDIKDRDAWNQYQVSDSGQGHSHSGGTHDDAAIEHFEMTHKLDKEMLDASISAILVDNRHRLVPAATPITITVNSQSSDSSEDICPAVPISDTMGYCEPTALHSYDRGDTLAFRFGIDRAALLSAGFDSLNLLYSIVSVTKSL